MPMLEFSRFKFNKHFQSFCAEPRLDLNSTVVARRTLISMHGGHPPHHHHHLTLEEGMSKTSRVSVLHDEKSLGNGWW